MKRAMIVPAVFGLVGVAILLSLCLWQVRRLAEKETQLQEIDRRIAAGPVALPNTPAPERDAYLPVTATGVLTGERLEVLASVKQIGAIQRVIAVLDVGDRRILLDRGYRSALNPADYAATGNVDLIGNLHWPDEVDRFTPAPEEQNGLPLFFARDVAGMADILDTEPVLIVARQITPADRQLTPLPVSSAGIPNDHLEYAVTWFLLAIVWAGMTVFLLWRMRPRAKV